jgi:hypothetical protein
MSGEPKSNQQKVARVTLLTLLTIIIALFAASSWMIFQTKKAENHIRYITYKNLVAEKMAITIKGMEINAKMVFGEVGKHLESPESVVEALSNTSYLSPDVRGYFAAFEPHHFTQKGKWFEPYMHQEDSNGLTMRQVGSPRHDYTKSEWYVQAENRKECFWSDPYYYYDGTNISGHYSTYAKPLYDENGKMICVCGADVTFEWLARDLQKEDESFKHDELLNKYAGEGEEDFFTVIMSSDGSCIAYPEGKRVATDSKQLLDDLANKKNGIVETTINGVRSTVYYGPIGNMDWTVAIVVPQHAISPSTLKRVMVLLVISIIGFAFVLSACRRIRNA